MRRWIVALVLLGALLAWLRHAALAPFDHGIYQRAFWNPEKAAEPVEHQVGPVASSEALRPNLLAILVDDLGYGDLGVQGAAPSRHRSRIGLPLKACV